MTGCEPDELLVQVWGDAAVPGKEESMLEFKRRALVVVSLIIIIYKYGQPFIGLSNLIPSFLAWDRHPEAEMPAAVLDCHISSM
jgi:hypothetical protein